MRREPLVYAEEPKTLIAQKFKECVKEAQPIYAVGNLDILVAEFVAMSKETDQKAAVYLTLLADRIADRALPIEEAEAEQIAAELRRIAQDIGKP